MLKKLSVNGVVWAIFCLLIAVVVSTIVTGAWLIWSKNQDVVGNWICFTVGCCLGGLLLAMILIKFILKLKYKSISLDEAKSICKNRDEISTSTALFMILNPIQADKLGFELSGINLVNKKKEKKIGKTQEEI